MTTSRSPLRVSVSHAVYVVLFHLACLLALPTTAVRALRDREQWGWLRGRLGSLPGGAPSSRPIWVHAVSVGEVKASRPLLAALAAHPDGPPIVLSTGTATGRETARRLFPHLYVFPWPLDLPWVVGRVLRRIDPRLLVLLELEVWPTAMRLADRAGVPQIIVNGRVSESSFRTYARLRWWLPEFDRIRLAAAQDETYAERIRRLGVPADRVVVTGNLKHDVVGGVVTDQRLAASLGLDDGRPVVVAGSTHEGEEELVVRAWRALGTRAHLVLVPRHLDRLKEIGRRLRRLETRWVLRSAAGPDRAPDTVLLVDTMGELEAFFTLADVVFLGGSLVPVGGHNVLEPALAGRPVLVGPWLETCRREADVLAAAGGLEVVDADGLGASLAALLADPERRRAMGRAAARAVAGLQGATERNLRLLEGRGLLRPGRKDASESDTLCGSSRRPETSRSGAPIP